MLASLPCLSFIAIERGEKKNQLNICNLRGILSYCYRYLLLAVCPEMFTPKILVQLNHPKQVYDTILLFWVMIQNFALMIF